MKLKDRLTKWEREELQNVMRHEPVFAGDTISHHTAKSLKEKGFIERNKNGEWVVRWAHLKSQIKPQ